MQILPCLWLWMSFGSSYLASSPKMISEGFWLQCSEFASLCSSAMGRWGALLSTIHITVSCPLEIQYFFLPVMGTESWTLHMLSKGSTTELFPHYLRQGLDLGVTGCASMPDKRYWPFSRLSHFKALMLLQNQCNLPAPQFPRLGMKWKKHIISHDIWIYLIQCLFQKGPVRDSCVRAACQQRHLYLQMSMSWLNQWGQERGLSLAEDRSVDSVYARKDLWSYLYGGVCLHECGCMCLCR